MTTRITQSQLESYLWGAAVLLRGYIDAGDYKQFIFPLLFYKRLCDVFDEEVAAALEESGGDQAYAHFAENHRFQIPEDAHWNTVRKASKNVGVKLQNALRAIETANLHLKQWGNLADGDISFTKRFRKGQVLFGKRRAYQRKVAVAEFDGICSSDILTFEPRDDALVPELLPFIVQSDGFFDHALGTSSGSLIHTSPCMSPPPCRLRFNRQLDLLSE